VPASEITGRATIAVDHHPIDQLQLARSEWISVRPVAEEPKRLTPIRRNADATGDESGERPCRTRMTESCSFCQGLPRACEVL